MVMITPMCAQTSIVPENAKPPKKKNQIPYYEFLLEFENNLREHGFAKQITLWNLIPPTGPKSQAAYLNGGDYAQVVRHLVGIWVNYQDKLVMIRMHGNILTEGQVVPFDQIAEVRVKIDSREETKTQGRARPFPPGPPGFRSKTNTGEKTVSQEIVTGAEVTIVTKSANGVQNYRIYISGTSPQAVPLIQDIADEIDFIVNEYKEE